MLASGFSGQNGKFAGEPDHQYELPAFKPTKTIMIVSKYPYWPRILKQTGKLLSVLFLLSVISYLINRDRHLLRFITIPEAAVSILGAALGILLAFRTNAAYARWWEARILWGAMVNGSRSLARQAISFAGASDQAAETRSRVFASTFIYRQIAFVHATRCALRGEEPWTALQPFLDSASLLALKQERNVALALLQQMGVQLMDAVSQHILNDWHMQRIDSTLTDLSNVLGACERIKNTPLPRQYDYYPELLIKVYCIVLPFIIVDEVGLFTPVVTVLVSFAFLVLNRIGKNLEDPFENVPYDVPIASLSRTIEINLRQALAEKELPEPLQPVAGVLM
jgi:ion channel-forming bestrophin family protein